MLTARSVVITTIVVAVVSVIAATVSLLGSPDNGGFGGDTYGTRAHGQRAFYEILRELNVPVERQLVPPTTALDRQVTLVFWSSHRNLVSLEPAYLQSVARWVRRGGRVVVAPASEGASSFNPSMLQGLGSPTSVESVLDALGLGGVGTETVYVGGSLAGAPVASPRGRFPVGPPSKTSLEPIRNIVKQVFSPEKVATLTIKVQAGGDLSYLDGLVSSLEVPDDGLQVVVTGTSKPSGTLTYQSADGSRKTVAATFRLGQGEVVVVGDPKLAQNRTVASGDNCVLVAHLAAGGGHPVVFDEFYHGFTIRGNPLWLLTRPAYAVLVVALLTIIGLWAWHQAIFLGPPLKSAGTMRRSIGEYIEAASRFFNRGLASRPFLMREVRDGVLWKLRQELGLSCAGEGPEQVIAALERQDPRRARQLAEALGTIDVILTDKTHTTERASVRALEGISACL